MVIIIIVAIVILMFSISRVNTKKTLLNDTDRELFYKYRGMIENKIKRPENMSEWEIKIWELAIKDRENEREKKFWVWSIIFLVVLVVFGVMISQL